MMEESSASRLMRVVPIVVVESVEVAVAAADTMIVTVEAAEDVTTEMIVVDVDGTGVILVTEIGDAEADPIQGIVGTGAGAIQGDEEEVAARIGASPEAEVKRKRNRFSSHQYQYEIHI